MASSARKFQVVEGGCSIKGLNPIEQPIAQPLNNLEKWLPIDALASLARVSSQAVQKAPSARRWRGAELQIRMVNIGRGGAGGLAPQVHVDSLPADLREAWYLERGVVLSARVEPATGLTVLVPQDRYVRDARHEAALVEARWRRSVIQPVLRQKARTAKRSAALQLATQAWVDHPEGGKRLPSKSRIYEWVAGYEREGLNGLVDRPRKDAGRRKVAVSTVWDGVMAALIGEARAQEMGGALVQRVRDLWASGMPGWRRVAEHATTWLLESSRYRDGQGCH